jgi:hypothetical protein
LIFVKAILDNRDFFVVGKKINQILCIFASPCLSGALSAQAINFITTIPLVVATGISKGGSSRMRTYSPCSHASRKPRTFITQSPSGGLEIFEYSSSI